MAPIPEEMRSLDKGLLLHLCRKFNAIVFEGINSLSEHSVYPKIQMEIDILLHQALQSLMLHPFDKGNPQVDKVEIGFFVKEGRHLQMQRLYIMKLEQAVKNRMMHPAQFVHLLYNFISAVLWDYEFKLVDIWPRPLRYTLEKKVLRLTDRTIQELCQRIRWKLHNQYGYPSSSDVRSVLWIQWKVK